ncbi:MULTISPECIES: AEC family transporter [Thalassospira]|uniref:AEC family transporter n=2 Tax=Thalassospira TaxID=168934 RepID=A0A358I050_9PROT|nr:MULTISPECIES: AEC family transporter [Thalassospira]PKR57974.1 permease [Thalassospira lohafexi]HBV00435.1 AEC family transporter [Thalassospira lucentensis]HCW65645.1 AEC family transporter [Thalassospira lucentensis]|tara:strand:- start:1502 stop:2428 length:927 start_codon:yes stop_codon:yes gene_type:complete
MQVAYELIAAIFPIFAAILVGAALKRYLITGADIWAGIDRLTYYLLLPSLLIVEIYRADFSSGNAGTAVTVTLFATLGLSAVLLLLRPVITRNTPLFTSIFQGSVRYNSYVLLAVADAFYGSAGLALAIVFIAVMVIATNMLGVVVLSAFSGGKSNLKRILGGIVKNPIILAAGAGAVLNISDIHVPVPIENTAALFKTAALPLSLLSVGAGLRFVLDKQALGAIALATTIKLAVLPVITGVCLYLAGIDGMVLAMGVLYAGMPCAGNAYILARQLNGDPDAMASIITLETLLSAFSVAVIAGVLSIN